MRNVIYASFLLACVSSAALAQTRAQQRLVEATPGATASLEQRESWRQ